MDVWRLTIEKVNGKCVSVCGTEESLLGEIEAWEKCEKKSVVEWAELESRGEVHRCLESLFVRRIHGFHESADRPPVLIALRYQDVVGMALVRLG